MTSARPRRGELRHWRVQTALAVVALAVAVALPVILLSVGGGVAAHELARLEGSGYQIVLSSGGAHGIDRAHQLARSVNAQAPVAVASPVLSEALVIHRSDGGFVPVLVEGILPSAFLATLASEDRGLFPDPLPLGDPTDAVHWANGTYAGPSAGRIVLSGPIASTLGASPGSSIEVGATTSGAGTRNFTVGGLFAAGPARLGATAAFAALLPLSDLQNMTGLAGLDAVDTVEVALGGSAATDPATVDRVAASLQVQYPYYVVTTLAETVAQTARAADILTGFYLALSSAGLAVGLLFLALVLVRRVESQRPILAIRRALGEPARAIIVRIASEATGLAAAGAAGGLIVGTLAVGALARWGSSSVRDAASLAVFEPVTLGLLAAGVIGLGTLASIVACRIAVHGPIAEALR